MNVKMIFFTSLPVTLTKAHGFGWAHVRTPANNLLSTLEYKPQEQLQMSLHHVNELLADIDTKIGKERQFLSQLEGQGKQNDSNNLPRMPDLKISSIVEEWARQNSGLIYPETDIDKTLRQTTERRIRLPISLPVKRQGPAPVSLVAARATMPTPQAPMDELPQDVEPEEIPGLPPGWPFNTESTTTSPVTENVTEAVTEKPTIRARMAKLMKTLEVGYGFATVVGLIDLAAEKDDSDLGPLINPFVKTGIRLADQGKLDALGKDLVKRIKLLWIWSTLVSTDIIKDNAGAIKANFLTLDSFAEDIDMVFKQYDSLINTQEGEHIFATVEALEKYRFAQHGHSTAEVLMERLFEVLTAPINRNRGSLGVRTFIARANRAYAIRYPEFRRSETFNVLSTIIDLEETLKLNTRRRMNTDFKYFKTKYKKLIRHLILKHSKLFKYFAKHYHNSEKRKHHHSRRRKHRPHYRKHHSSKKQKHGYYHKHEAEEGNIEITTEGIMQGPIDRFQDTTQDSPFFRESSTMNTTCSSTTVTTTTVSNKKRYSIVSERPGLSKRISPSVLTRRSMIHDRNSYGKNQELLKHKSNQRAASQKVKNAKGLRKNLSDSSSIDEENYLRTMLYDALFHGNDTFTSNRAHKAQGNMRAELSDSDEEWIFKSNIYKFFQRPQM